MGEPLRSFGSFIAGLDDRGRARSCAALKSGDVLQLAALDGGAVGVQRDGRLIGFLPAQHTFVAQSLAEGDQLACVVEAVAFAGWPRRRAEHVALRIDVMRDGSATLRALQWSTATITQAVSGAAEFGGKATTAAASLPRGAARVARDAASVTGRAVFRGIDGAAELAVRRPARMLRRLILWTVGIVVGLMLLAFAILIALHTLPRRG